MSDSYDRARQLLDQLVYAPSIDTGPNGVAKADIISLEQRSLFERLQSFTPVTWFGKPTGLSAVTCATKGWRNTGPDVLTCDSCGAKIWCKLPVNLVSDTAAGIIKGFEQQLTDAHDAACIQRSIASSDSLKGPRLHLAPQIRFPILPSSKLSSSYHSRLQELQRLEPTPQLAGTAVQRLLLAAKQLHPSLPRALATLMQLPVEQLEQQASAATSAAGQAVSPVPLQLSKQQVLAVLALCGWQVQPLLPAHLAKSTAARPSSAFGVSHLVPRSSAASSSAAAAAAAGGNSRDSGIGAEHAVLHCELCGCKAGMWRLSQSGPYYMAQLASKAMSMLLAAEAAHSSSNMAAVDSAHSNKPIQHPHSPAAAAGSDKPSSNPLSTIAGGVLQLPAAADTQQLQRQNTDEPIASPEAVVSSLYHTIAGGSLLGASVPAAAVSGGGTSGFATSSGFRGSSPTAAGFGRASPGFGAQGPAQGTNGMLTSPNRPGPFGAPAAPAFGGSPAAAVTSSSSLFGLATAAPAANVFGDAAAPAAPPGGSGPFGAAASLSPAAAPVFGLGALREQEQRTKRRRSSSDAAAGLAAVRQPSLGRSMSASPAGTKTLASPSVGLGLGLGSAAGPSPQPGLPPIKQQRTDAGSAPTTAAAGASGGPRSFMKQASLLAAAADAAGAAAAATACFDPLGQHRSWCPWVNRVNPNASPGGVAADPAQAIKAAAGVDGMSDGSGISAALAVGWSSTLLALQEHLEEQQLLSAGEQEEQQGMHGLLGGVPKPGQFESTAAVLAKARKMFDILES